MLAAAGAEELETFYVFCEDVGLPTILAYIGLGIADHDRLMITEEKACAPEQHRRQEEGVVTSIKMLGAMLVADDVGRAGEN